MAQAMASKDSLSGSNHGQLPYNLFKPRLHGMYDLSIEILSKKNTQEAQRLSGSLLDLIRRTRGEIGGGVPPPLMQAIAESLKAHIDVFKESYDPEDAGKFLGWMESFLMSAIAGAPERTLYSGGVRPATLDDLQDMPLLCMGGFSDSPVFQLQRPNYAKSPGLTLRLFKLRCLEAFLSHIPIFVSEDSYDPSEQEEFPETLPQRCLRAGKDGRVIVGIAMITGLEEEPLSDSERAYLEYLKEDVQNLAEDRDMAAVESYRLQTEAAKSEYFKGSKFQVNTLAVLKPYRGRGHGKFLLDACVKRADSYSGSMAGSFTPWSRNIARRAGFNIKDCPVEHEKLSFIMGLGVRPFSG
ncbi:hypothetical protein AOQ84DRAFT_29655 [Glonium stellatum]|uniref:N-acetyltransferase domain-containing protein n=1 Tax=Glonium stellatum TaxID=574774 RepID=A0A8E2F214_9PEZI|nr:hypothetical protein AOQ84DRAFT_29655 [Glonium stellatum]